MPFATAVCHAGSDEGFADGGNNSFLDTFAALLLLQALGGLADRKRLPPLHPDREKKIFQLSVYLAAAANNLIVLGFTLASPQQYAHQVSSKSDFSRLQHWPD